MQQDVNGYWYSVSELPTLLTLPYYPEQPKTESGIIRDFLNVHGLEYDRFGFSVRVGRGATADPTHLPEIQALARWWYAKRLDLIAFRGPNPTLIEAKRRITQAVLGQLFSYRALWLQDNPDAPEPRLLAIGRWIDPDMQSVLAAHGIDAYTYAAD